MIVVGWGLTWTSAAVGIGLAVRLLDSLRSADVAAPQVVPPAAAPAPAPEMIIAREEPVAEPAAEPAAQHPGGLSCKHPRFRAIGRAIQKYCRAPNPDDDGAFLCADITGQLNSCRIRSGLVLTHEPECHPAGVNGSRTICHDFLAQLSEIDEYVPYIALKRFAGRWKVVEIEYDDMERP